MAILKIFTYPDPILREKAVPVTEFNASLQELVNNMFETMYDAPGVGLAANQIGLAQQILVLDVDYNIQASDHDDSLRVYVNKNPILLINPEIYKKDGKIIFKEGCLSVPGYTEEVSRSQAISVRYQNIKGQNCNLDAEGLLAIAIQHEMDHLEGRLFIDRLSPLKRSMAKGKIRKERNRNFERSKFHVEL